MRNLTGVLRYKDKTLIKCDEVKLYGSISCIYTPQMNTGLEHYVPTLTRLIHNRFVSGGRERKLSEFAGLVKTLCEWK